jgi:glycerol uptake operon antiterminator
MMGPVLLRKKRTLNPEEFGDLLRRTPVIRAVKSLEGLESCLAEEGGLVFVLFGDILGIGDMVARIKDAGKLAMVHIDLIDGLSPREAAVDFLADKTRSDGILSTKANLIKHAKSRGLLTIQRFFVLDSLSLINIEKQFPLEYADAIEILPGVMPKIIRRIAGMAKKPVIAGGLIADKEDVRHALSAGAVSVSSSNKIIL